MIKVKENLNKYTAEYPAGTMFYNSTKNVFCFCDGTNDLEIHDNSACF